MELGLRQLGSQAWPSHLREPASSLSLSVFICTVGVTIPHTYLNLF